MPADIATAAFRLSWEFAPGTWAEPMQFGVHTGVRDEANYQDLADEMLTFFQNLEPQLGELRLTALVISDWATGPGFTGWHQVFREVRNDVLGTPTWMPPQIALVVGVRNTTELAIPLGRRRNRSYLGSLNQDTMDDVGQLEVARQATITAAFNQFNDDLIGVPTFESPDPQYGGLCVASPTAGLLMTGEQLVVGRAFDTMRSRRQKVPELPLITNL